MKFGGNVAFSVLLASAELLLWLHNLHFQYFVIVSQPVLQPFASCSQQQPLTCLLVREENPTWSSQSMQHPPCSHNLYNFSDLHSIACVPSHTLPDIHLVHLPWSAQYLLRAPMHPIWSTSSPHLHWTTQHFLHTPDALSPTHTPPICLSQPMWCFLGISTWPQPTLPPGHCPLSARHFLEIGKK